MERICRRLSSLLNILGSVDGEDVEAESYVCHKIVWRDVSGWTKLKYGKGLSESECRSSK